MWRDVDIFSYMKYMLDYLSLKPVGAPTSSSNFKTIRAKDGVSHSVIIDCLRRLSCWVQLCVAVMCAEFPDSELIQCFSVFNVTNDLRKNHGSNDYRQQWRKANSVLAPLIKCDEVKLHSQVSNLEPFAWQHHLKTGLLTWIAGLL